MALSGRSHRSHRRHGRQRGWGRTRSSGNLAAVATIATLALAALALFSCKANYVLAPLLQAGQELACRHHVRLKGGIWMLTQDTKLRVSLLQPVAVAAAHEPWDAPTPVAFCFDLQLLQASAIPTKCFAICEGIELAKCIFEITLSFLLCGPQVGRNALQPQMQFQQFCRSGSGSNSFTVQISSAIQVRSAS